MLKKLWISCALLVTIAGAVLAYGERLKVWGPAPTTATYHYTIGHYDLIFDLPPGWRVLSDDHKKWSSGDDLHQVAFSNPALPFPYAGSSPDEQPGALFLTNSGPERDDQADLVKIAKPTGAYTTTTVDGLLALDVSDPGEGTRLFPPTRTFWIQLPGHPAQAVALTLYYPLPHHQPETVPPVTQAFEYLIHHLIIQRL